MFVASDKRCQEGGAVHDSPPVRPTKASLTTGRSKTYILDDSLMERLITGALRAGSHFMRHLFCRFAAPSAVWRLSFGFLLAAWGASASVPSASALGSGPFPAGGVGVSSISVDHFPAVHVPETRPIASPSMRAIPLAGRTRPEYFRPFVLSVPNRGRPHRTALDYLERLTTSPPSSIPT